MDNTLPLDFDWKEYVYLNEDVKNNEEYAIRHYKKYGIKEKRIYKIDKTIIPNDFDWTCYIELNKDLKIKDEKNAIIHYIRYGINEKRKYKNDMYDEYDNTIINGIYDYINDNDILYTRPFLKENPNYLKYSIDIEILNVIPYFTLVVDFNNKGGGTTIFLNRIISKYKYYNSFLILRFDGFKYTLNINDEYKVNLYSGNLIEIISIVERYKFKCTKIFINHLIDFDKEFINYIFSLNIFKIGITHDYYNFLIDPQPTFKNIKSIELNNKLNINKYDMLITQNTTNKKYFSKYFKKKMEIVDLPDYLYKKDKITTLKNNIIKCCIIGNINDIKGYHKLKKIIQFFKNQNIEFFIIGWCKNDIGINFKPYNNIYEFNKLLTEFKPNLILELTIWPETYSYTLSLSMLTELPILYYKKPNYSVVKDRLKNYNKSYEFTDLKQLNELFFSKSQDYFYTIQPIIVYSKFWNSMFVDKTQKLTNINNTIFKYNIKPYFIYFPQFHEITENNINFYKGYSDIQNLKYYNENNIITKEIPSKNISTIDTYDYILNSQLIQKQINLIENYGFSGIAIYYYWFTENSLTNNHMIMDKIIDKFFDESIKMYDKKVFFIWANENWTDNIALNPHSYNKIINIYDTDSFTKNAQNLIHYFKHENYLKIDNKPVFFIYHTYLIDDIDHFYYILNDICIEHEFNGVHLVLNSFEKKYENYKNFYINFNYKLYESRFYDKVDKQIKLDYIEYMNNPYHSQENKLQTITYDFDNKPRLCNPERLKYSTVCINNTELARSAFTSKLIETYKNVDSEIDKILLINSLNEWGENMTFEPSDRYGYNNINLLYNCLKS
jgi:hypothetical protein